MKKENEKRFGFVTVIGAPNAGKSTLLNALVGSKVSIVSSKVQTTRTRVSGIVVRGKTQIVFVDTPGIFEPSKKNNLERAIVSAAWETVGETDKIILLVDVSRKVSNGAKKIISNLKENNIKNIILVLNKIDEIKRDKLLEITQDLNNLYDFEATFMISALKNNGLDGVLDYLKDRLPEGVWHYAEEDMTDMPMRLIAAEITREKLFKMMHQELPYNLTVETDEWEPFEDGSIKIHQTVYISREAHKKIIVGKGGEMLKKIGSMAREDLEEMMQGRIHLKIFVKVQENWMEDSERFSMWNLNPNAV